MYEFGIVDQQSGAYRGQVLDSATSFTFRGLKAGNWTLYVCAVSGIQCSDPVESLPDGMSHQQLFAAI